MSNEFFLREGPWYSTTSIISESLSIWDLDLDYSSMKEGFEEVKDLPLAGYAFGISNLDIPICWDSLLYEVRL